MVDSVGGSPSLHRSIGYYQPSWGAQPVSQVALWAGDGPVDEVAGVESSPLIPESDPVVEVVKGKKTRVQSRFFTWTLNIGKDAKVAEARVKEFAVLCEAMVADGELGFVSVGHEIGGETGEHHLQGYLEAPGKTRWGYETVKKFPMFLGIPLWIQASKGSAVQNKDYTGKAANEGRYHFVGGKFQNYGTGVDGKLVRAKEMLIGGSSLREVYNAEFEASAKYYRFFREFQQLNVLPRSWAMDVEYVYGPSGSGKSLYASTNYPAGDNCYWLSAPKHGTSVWWDNYCGQETVVIDDWYPGYFGTGHVAFMLRLFDRYPMQVPIHGGQVEFTSKRIVISTNWPPEKMDDKQFSGYEWDASNPLFSRVYLREKLWKLTKVGEYKPGDKHYVVPPEPRLSPVFGRIVPENMSYSEKCTFLGARINK